MSASRSSRRVPTPCPWSASSTVKATSARSGCCRKTKVVGDRDDAGRGGLADECELVVVVDAAESRGLLGVDLREREEPEIETVGGEPAVEGEQGGGVVRPDGPQTQGRARPEDDVPLLFPRVGGFSDGDGLVCFRHETSV